MVSKKIALKVLRQMPETFSIEEMIDRMFLLQKIERGLQESKSGKVYSTAEAKQKLKRWLR